ncbi:MAG: amino acid adenylation domain-containing protein [Gaiellaceae bacterium]
MITGLNTANILDGFATSVERFADRPALVVGDDSVTYEQLGETVGQIGATLANRVRADQPFVGLLAHRSLSAYAGVLGILAAGKAYVPLHPNFPLARTAAMVRLSQVDVLVVGLEAVEALADVLAAAERPMTVIVPELARAPDWAATHEQHSFITRSDLVSKAGPIDPARLEPTSLAYLLFTSGSTGEPKGVAVTHANVQAYVQWIVDEYDVSEHDRFSQTFDLTFDLSVHDMFVCWERGACLYSLPDRVLTAPARFVRDHKLTMWFSVPSMAGRLVSLRMLRPRIFPDLRVSLFCGEPLPSEYASAWQKAAPGSIVDNLYGPTEATIAITRYRWDEETSPPECVNGTVPIGLPFSGQRVRVVDQQGLAVPPGGDGELCLGGTQVTGGYLNDEAKTAKQFVTLPGEAELTWYRTGDLVRQDVTQCLHYLGRLDHQIKVRGFRVEVQEIEHVLRGASGGAVSIAVPWPVRHGSAEGIVAFVEAREGLDPRALIERCRQLLPEYMVPREVRVVDAMPLNTNGKIDRGKLAQSLAEAVHA